MPRLDAIWTGEVRASGLLVFDHPAAFERYKQSIAGNRFALRLEKRKLVRTLPQNAYFHGVVLPCLGEAIGCHPSDFPLLKLGLLEGCFGFRVVAGVQMPNKTSTSLLSIEDFGKLIDYACQLSAENGVVVPSPEDAL